MSEQPAIRLERMPPIRRFSVGGPLEFASTGDSTALRLGPDEWLVLGALPPEMPPGTSIVDVSHAFLGITVAGPRAADAINAFCALDLHGAAFPQGMCTRTLFGKAQIILWRTDTEAFRIEVARSIAPYVWGLLEQAGREFLV